MEKITLVYMGKRLSSKNVLANVFGLLPDLLPTNVLWFKSDLGAPTLGALIKVEYDKEKGQVLGPYVYVGKHSDATAIQTWSIQEANDKQRLAFSKRSKEKHYAHVDCLIDAVKKATYGTSERKRVVQYIIDKLL